MEVHDKQDKLSVKNQLKAFMAPKLLQKQTKKYKRHGKEFIDDRNIHS